MEILYPILILGGLGLLFGIILAFASKVFEIKADARITAIREALPGANCGACGQTGCDGYAEAIVSSGLQPNLCTVGGASAAQAIAGIMGVDVEAAEPKTARVLCNGKDSVCSSKYEYFGMEDCTAASQLFAGKKACSYGCLGLGSCVRACQFDAIVISGGIARVIEDKCVACGKCAAACPKGIIEIVPAAREYSVVCRSQDKGSVTKKNCEAGCIGCAKCVKICKYGAIKMEGPLAVISYELCTNCGECLEVCPTMAIRRMNY